MSDKYNKVSLDLPVMSQNVSYLMELSDSVDSKIKMIKQSIANLESFFTDNDAAGQHKKLFDHKQHQRYGMDPLVYGYAGDNRTDHKLISEGIENSAEICYPIISSGEISVQHISNRCNSINKCCTKAHVAAVFAEINPNENRH